MNYKKIVFPAVAIIILAGTLALGILIGVKTVYQVPQPRTFDFSLFWDAYEKLQNNFIELEKISNDKILYGAIDGMANSLGDPYTSFFDPEQAKKFQEDLSGSFEGIGVEIGIRKDMLTVVSPLKGTPGELAGLKAGDIIAKIDGKDSVYMTTDEAVSLIRGPKGTEVVLGIMREGWDNIKDITIVRAKIEVPSMDLSFKNGGETAYMQIYQFDLLLPTEFQNAALQILQSNAKNIVLDLRDNPGGYLEVAQNISGWLLESGQIVTIEDFGGRREEQTYKAQGNAQLAGYPIVVLLNEGSASASEILAGALRDNRGTKIIGAKSFGKGSVQEVIDLHGGSFLKITIAHWLTPNGSSISEVGLTPDVKIDITEQDMVLKNDPQLAKALEIVNSLK